MISNLFFTASDGHSPADLHKKFLDACKQNGQKWGLMSARWIIRCSPAPTRTSFPTRSGCWPAARPPATACRCWSIASTWPTGRKRWFAARGFPGSRFAPLRNLLGDRQRSRRVFAFTQSQEADFAGTALGAFGSAEAGVPTDSHRAVAAVRRSRSPRPARRAATLAAGASAAAALAVCGQASACQLTLAALRRQPRSGRRRSPSYTCRYGIGDSLPRTAVIPDPIPVR